MSEDTPTIGELTGGLVSIAFFFHMVVAALLTLPGGRYGPVSLRHAVIDSGAYIWGFVFLIVGTIVLYVLVAALTDYVWDGELRRDIRGWRDRE